MFKPQLYRLIQIHKPRAQKYVVDHILASYGHTVLRLPPYHPDLNPIEMIWSQVKEWVASRNVTFKTENVKLLCEQKFGEMGGKRMASGV
jgi:transposase